MFNHEIIHTIHLIIYHPSSIYLFNHLSISHVATRIHYFLLLYPSTHSFNSSPFHSLAHLLFSLIYLFIHFIHPQTVPSSIHPCTIHPSIESSLILPPVKFSIHSFCSVYQNQEMSYSWSLPWADHSLVTGTDSYNSKWTIWRKSSKGAPGKCLHRRDAGPPGDRDKVPWRRWHPNQDWMAVWIHKDRKTVDRLPEISQRVTHRPSIDPDAHWAC